MELTTAAFAHGWFGSPVGFLTEYLVFFEGMAAVGLITAELARRPAIALVRFVATAVIMVAVSLGLSVVGASVYYLPPLQRSGPLVAGTQNSFPSHHAWLAAVIVAVVFLVRRRAALPFALVTVAIDVALVLDHDHHVDDVVASTMFVGAAAGLALVTTRLQQRAVIKILAVRRRFRRNGRGPEKGGRVDVAS